MPIEERI